jgi:hypothetical protein
MDLTSTLRMAEIGGALLAALVLAYFIFRSAVRVYVAPNAGSVMQFESMGLRVCLQRRTWRFGEWTDIPGTFIVTVGPERLFEARPIRGGTNEIDTIFALDVFGTKPGAEKLRISGTVAGEEKARVLELRIAVTPCAEGEGRFRQTAAALAASVKA